MKYPITPDYLQHVPDELVTLYLDLETYIIQKICESLAINGEPNATALELISLAIIFFTRLCSANNSSSCP